MNTKGRLAQINSDTQCMHDMFIDNDYRSHLSKHSLHLDFVLPSFRFIACNIQ